MFTSKKPVLGMGLLAASVACGLAGGEPVSVQGQASTPTSPAASVAQVPEAREIGQAFAGVAERLAPSVVRIATRMQVGGRDGSARNPFEGTPFEDFFDNFGPGAPPSVLSGMGSGVVIDDHGHILTNNHVVADTQELRVTFVDGKELAAKVVGTDPKTDLAVIKVKGTSAPPAEFGDAAHLRVGEWVIAIGNPFGLDHSVTVGVLSAIGRHGFAPGAFEDFLQTDASINPGNSGGPLVDLNGRVIGINTMIAGLGTGVGFAVSESIARPITRQLIAHGKVVRPYVGIAMQTLTPELRRALGDAVPEHGALVAQVAPGSPAQRAGVSVGDVIISVGGVATHDSRAVQHAVLAQVVGTDVEIKLWRDGTSRSLRVRTEELPAEDPATPSRSAGNAQGELGLSMQTLTPDLADQLDVDRNLKGAVVAAVRPGGIAAEAGLRLGDVIVDIDRKPVHSAQAAATQLGQRRAAGHLVHAQRGDAAFFFVLASPR